MIRPPRRAGHPAYNKGRQTAPSVRVPTRSEEATMSVTVREKDSSTVLAQGEPVAAVAKLARVEDEGVARTEQDRLRP